MARKLGIRLLFLIGSIDEKVAGEMAKIIMKAEPCLLIIDSGGGDILAGEALSAVIRDNEKVTGVVVGRADSMAIPVLQSCARRIALPSATFLFHSVRAYREIEAMDMFDKGKVQAFADSIQEVQERYWHRVLRRVAASQEKPKKELTPALLRQWCTQEVRLSAEEAQAYGLVDDVKALTEIVNVSALGFQVPS